MKVGKPKSKRVPVRLRHKIQKASAAKQRKDRKLGKKDPTWRSKLKKDPGVPNLFPYKDKIIKELEEGRRRKAEETKLRQDQARTQKSDKAPNGSTVTLATGSDAESEELLDLEDDNENEAMDDEGNTENPMAALLASARARATAYDPGNASGSDEMDEDDEDVSDADSFSSFAEARESKSKDASRSYTQTLNNLIKTSDIILYILDARDPLATRSESIEATIISNPNKRLIFVLNKIDLVPTHVLKAWLLHLRKSFPTLPLRSSTSAPSAKQFDHSHLTPQFTANNLIRALKAYATPRVSTTVGIVGYPNVGKSSIVNALAARLAGRGPNGRRKKECPVGAEAGITTSLREVKLDGKIRLVDSPGVVFPTTTNGEAKGNKRMKDPDEWATLVLLNAVPPQEIGDPMPAVSLLLRRLENSQELMTLLMETYGLPALMRSGESRDLTTDFLVQVARKRGRLGKGGIPNLHAAAQTVLADWRDGRIQGWVEAPVADDSTRPAGRNAKDQKVIVTEWAKEFTIEGLWGESVEASEDAVEVIGEDVAMAT